MLDCIWMTIFWNPIKSQWISDECNVKPYCTHWLSQLRCFTHWFLFNYFSHHHLPFLTTSQHTPFASLTHPLSPSHCLPCCPLSSTHSPPSIFLPSSSPHPAHTLLSTHQITSLCPAIRFTLIFMKKRVGWRGWGGGGGVCLGVEEDNREEMKEEKMREKGGEMKRRWGDGVIWEGAKKLIEGHSAAWNNFLNTFWKKMGLTRF